MTRTITIDFPPALDAILVEKATGNDTPETLCVTIIKEWCEPHAKAAEARLLDLMSPVGAEIAAAAGGDVAKITAALEAGKTAALKTLS